MPTVRHPIIGIQLLKKIVIDIGQVSAKYCKTRANNICRACKAKQENKQKNTHTYFDFAHFILTSILSRNCKLCSSEAISFDIVFFFLLNRFQNVFVLICALGFQ